jgi:uncharacterized protein YxjI
MFTLSKYLIKEHVSFLKLSDSYDILDPNSGAKLGYAKETISIFAKLLRLVIPKQIMPTTVGIFNNEERQIVELKKKGLLRAQVLVYFKDQHIATLKSKLFSIGGAFTVLSPENAEMAKIQGNWKGWSFTFSDINGNEIGKIAKKWAGIGKELFTSADNYMVSFEEGKSHSEALTAIFVSAALAIDIIYKEKE